MTTTVVNMILHPSNKAGLRWEQIQASQISHNGTVIFVLRLYLFVGYTKRFTPILNRNRGVICPPPPYYISSKPPQSEKVW